MTTHQSPQREPPLSPLLASVPVPPPLLVPVVQTTADAVTITHAPAPTTHYLLTRPAIRASSRHFHDLQLQRLVLPEGGGAAKHLPVLNMEYHSMLRHTKIRDVLTNKIIAKFSQKYVELQGGETRRASVGMERPHTLSFNLSGGVVSEWKSSGQHTWTGANGNTQLSLEEIHPDPSNPSLDPKVPYLIVREPDAVPGVVAAASGAGDASTQQGREREWVLIQALWIAWATEEGVLKVEVDGLGKRRRRLSVA
ncbi:hypothetical protein YB2330_005385 [Saitoella coloradoensis]